MAGTTDLKIEVAIVNPEATRALDDLHKAFEKDQQLLITQADNLGKVKAAEMRRELIQTYSSAVERILKASPWATPETKEG